MKEITLNAFVADKGQAEAARHLRVTPPAIHKAISAGRDIRVLELADGTFSAIEQRPFPVPTEKKSKPNPAASESLSHAS